MKKAYVSPEAEKLEFKYNEIVTASGGGDTKNEADATNCYWKSAWGCDQACTVNN